MKSEIPCSINETFHYEHAPTHYWGRTLPSKVVFCVAMLFLLSPEIAWLTDNANRYFCTGGDAIYNIKIHLSPSTISGDDPFIFLSFSML